ncbi:MAG: DNA polymerase III subunit delta', partial [Xanthobacteraceae bacterium]
MSEAEQDFDEAPPPRLTDKLFGHAATEAALLAAYRGGRVPHAFMLIGQKGIGKATLAYRMARFVLAHADPAAPAVAAATSLAVDPEHPVARRVAAQGHGDLLILERTRNEKGVLRQQIAVEDVRRTVSFFGATAGEGGWRVAIVDAVDELNRAGANALLKVLEEPPERALLILVCHAASKVLPTLRSRCAVLPMRPLTQADVARALAASVGSTV